MKTGEPYSEDDEIMKVRCDKSFAGSEYAPKELKEKRSLKQRL